MTNDIDTIVIGAGVIGLAIARKFATSGRGVIILEKESIIGSGISSRNSEVVHAGIYNPQGFLKTSLCIGGNELLYDYAISHHIPFKKCGKLIVATEESELEKLQDIYANTNNNGLDNLIFLNRATVGKLEPELSCHTALYSPSTGIIDSHQLMLSFLGEAEDCGASIAYNSRFMSATPLGSGFQVRILIEKKEIITLSCRNIINCSGLFAQAVAAKIEGYRSSYIPEIYLVKGNYFSMTGHCPFQHLIYPIPEAGGLGIHLTFDMNGQTRFGPDVELVDKLDYEVNLDRKEFFYQGICKFFPKLRKTALYPAYSGIRPKLSLPSGKIEDFIIQGPEIHKITGLVNLYGIESPGLTSSLAIADYVFSLTE